MGSTTFDVHHNTQCAAQHAMCGTTCKVGDCVSADQVLEGQMSQPYMQSKHSGTYLVTKSASAIRHCDLADQ